MSDEEVLAFATFEGRAVLTLNRKHFRNLHQLDAHHAGIVICTFDRNFPEQALRIHQSLLKVTTLSGQLVGVNRPDQ